MKKYVKLSKAVFLRNHYRQYEKFAWCESILIWVNLILLAWFKFVKKSNSSDRSLPVTSFRNRPFYYPFWLHNSSTLQVPFPVFIKRCNVALDWLISEIAIALLFHNIYKTHKKWLWWNLYEIVSLLRQIRNDKCPMSKYTRPNFWGSISILLVQIFFSNSTAMS